MAQKTWALLDMWNMLQSHKFPVPSPTPVFTQHSQHKHISLLSMWENACSRCLRWREICFIKMFIESDSVDL